MKEVMETDKQLPYARLHLFLYPCFNPMNYMPLVPLIRVSNSIAKRGKNADEMPQQP